MKILNELAIFEKETTDLISGLAAEGAVSVWKELVPVIVLNLVIAVVVLFGIGFVLSKLLLKKDKEKE